MRDLEDQQIGQYAVPSRNLAVPTHTINSLLNRHLAPTLYSARTKDFKAALQDYLASTQAQPNRTAATTDSASSSAAPSPAPSTSTTTTEGGAGSLSRVGLVGRDKMLKVAEMATAAVRAGEDKVGLAITLYDAVRCVVPSLLFLNSPRLPSQICHPHPRLTLLYETNNPINKPRTEPPLPPPPSSRSIATSSASTPTWRGTKTRS